MWVSPLFLSGKAAVEWGRSDKGTPQSRRGSSVGMSVKWKSTGTREAPSVRARDSQPELREEQAGPYGVADRPVVPLMPGNAGGGKLSRV